MFKVYGELKTSETLMRDAYCSASPESCRTCPLAQAALL